MVKSSTSTRSTSKDSSNNGVQVQVAICSLIMSVLTIVTKNLA